MTKRKCANQTKNFLTESDKNATMFNLVMLYNTVQDNTILNTIHDNKFYNNYTKKNMILNNI